MSKKRLAITLFDIVSVVILTAYAMLAIVPSAYAYVDPSVMTYAIQAFAGVAVALGAVLGVVLRRSRKFLFKALNIDENANKEVEPDIHRLDDEGRPVGVTEASKVANGLPPKKRAKTKVLQTPQWGGRLVYSLIVSIFTVFTLFVVAPYEIVASNAVDLIFGISDLWLLIAIPSLIGAVTLAFVLSALRGKVFHGALLIVFSIGLAAYFQAFFLNGALPAADGRAVPWDDYTAIMVVSTAVWAAIIILPLVLSRWFGARCRAAAVVLSACLIVVQVAGVVSLFTAVPGIEGATSVSQQDSAGASPMGGERQITEEGLFEVAPSNNVIVLMVDTVDVEDFNTVLENDPSIKDRLNGFTYFENSIGSMIPTRYAVPYLLSGQLPRHDESIGEYLTYKYDRSTFLPEISAAGYSIGLYSDSILLDPYFSPERQQIADSTLNIHPLEEAQKSASLNKQGALQSLWKCALYRDMPWPLKPLFWFYTDEVNNSMVNWSVDATGGGVPYAINDFSYYEKLKNIKLSVDDVAAKGSFKLIHLAGMHEPYSMDENGHDVGLNNSTREKQGVGTFKIVDEYLNQLRTLGVYDDATIIVMADHGRWYLTDELLEPSCPLMIVKPSASSPYASNDPLRISDVPASHLDFEATVIEAMGLDSSKYGTSLFALTNEPRTRMYYMTLAENEKEVGIEEFEVRGDALDFSAWHSTGKKWPSG